MPSNMVVYKITNIIDGKIYIGITKQGVMSRWYKHCSESKYGSTTYLHNAIRKYDKSNFVIEIVETIDNETDYDQLKEREIYWISYFNSNDRSIGYNLTIGGDGCFGRVLSDDTKNKISDALTGIKHSEETIEKFRNRNSVNKAVIQISLEGDIIDEFKSCSEAARELSYNKDVISAVARHLRKRAYNYIWVYKNELICDAE